ncbi:MAG: Nif3-like dinuclear metal center hexameric protein [Oscillospiraceae bacterium]
MVKTAEIIQFFEKAVPNEMKMDFDNVGFLVGDSQRDVDSALVSLDITDEVVSEAIALGAGLIVSHHPMFFQLKSVTDATPEGRKIVKLLRANISAICLHTSLDSVQGGVNDALIKTLGCSNLGILEPEQELPDGRVYGCGRFGELPEAKRMAGFLEKVKTALRSNGLRYYDAGVPVKRIAVCGGSGGSMIADAVLRGCDTYVTADIKYDQFLTAKELGLNIIDADHFCTENVVVPVIAGMLNRNFPKLDVKISAKHTQCIKFY